MIIVGCSRQGFLKYQMGLTQELGASIEFGSVEQLHFVGISSVENFYRL